MTVDGDMARLWQVSHIHIVVQRERNCSLILKKKGGRGIGGGGTLKKWSMVDMVPDSLQGL